MTTIQYPMSSKSIMSDLTLDYRVSCPFSVWKKTDTERGEMIVSDVAPLLAHLRC